MAKKNTLPRYLTTVTSFSKYLALALFILLPILGVYFGIWYQKVGHTLAEPSFKVNLRVGASQLRYFTAQITSPGGYFATDDNMLTSYDSQGGMAPPRVILSKNKQAHDEDTFSEIMNSSKNDCVIVWSSNGFTRAEDWYEMIAQSQGGIFTQEESLRVGKRTAQIYSVKDGNKTIYVGFLPIGTPDDTSYYFHTCNTNNKADLMSVIQSILFRDDLSL